MRVNKNEGVFVQAGILAVAGIIVRIIGLLYTSPLTAIIGDEGNGYYGYAYNCYVIVLLLSSYSIPSAVSKLISARLATGEYRNAQKVLRYSVYYVLAVGTVAALILFFGAPLLVRDANAAPVLRIFAPTIFFYGLLGVLRGYFQAHRSMVQTSVSQILEQIVNAVVSIGAAWLLMKHVADADETTRAVYGAAGSAFGTGCGVVFALLFIAATYRINHPMIARRVRRDLHDEEDGALITKSIILFVTPFLLSSFIYNFATMLDQTIFTNYMIDIRGVPAKDVAISYGVFSRKAVVITNIPIALASAISSAMIPGISAGYARGETEEIKALISRVVRMTMRIAIPSAVGLFALSRPVMMVLFPQKATLDQASYLLRYLAVTVIFYSLSTVTNAVLQGIGRVTRPMVHAAVALVTQAAVLLLMLHFTGQTNLSLVVALIVYSGLMCLLNDIAVMRCAGVRLPFVTTYLGPFAISIAMGASAFALHLCLEKLLSLFMPGVYFANLIATLAAIALAVFVYGILLLRTGMITEDELNSLPGMGRFSGYLRTP